MLSKFDFYLNQHVLSKSWSSPPGAPNWPDLEFSTFCIPSFIPHPLKRFNFRLKINVSKKFCSCKFLWLLCVSLNVIQDKYFLFWSFPEQSCILLKRFHWSFAPVGNIKSCACQSCKMSTISSLEMVDILQVKDTSQ